jgi:hypothetical protein
MTADGVTRFDSGDFPLGMLNDAAMLLYEARHWYSLRPEFIERIEAFLQSVDWHPPGQTLDRYNRQIARERIEARRAGGDQG